jgi:hypothetical protein
MPDNSYSSFAFRGSHTLRETQTNWRKIGHQRKVQDDIHKDGDDHSIEAVNG